MLVLGLVLFGAAYTGYSRIFGAIDGLPNIPERYLEADDSPLPPPKYGESPTIARLKEAFGPNCAEVESSYPTRLEQRDQGIVFAAGRPDPIDSPSRFVRMSPFSMAQFGKAKPGERPEVTTMHSDEAIIELDRPIGNEREMLAGRAKIIGMELRAVPNNTARTDARNGRVIITNNQQSQDPNKFFVFKTPGPVFYRTQDHPDLASNPNAPHIWTSAVVEIVNRENQPHPIHGTSLPSVPLNADDVLSANIIADMTLGLHTPPPTIIAEGMKIYLKPSKPDPTKPAPKGGTGFGGVRAIVFIENVEFNFWSDGNSSLLGQSSNAKMEVGKPTEQSAEPTIAHQAVFGGLVDGATAAKRIQEKSLIRIRTLGEFQYDWEKNICNFEIAQQANPVLANNVEVTRTTCQGGRDHLVCQKLEIEFNGPIGRSTATAPTTDKTKPAQQQSQFKNLRATGPSVYLASETEQLQTFGTAIIHETDPTKRLTRTTLRGAPLVAVRQGNRLTTGTVATTTKPEAVGTLVLESIEPAPNTKDIKQTRIEVLGPGKVDLFDEQTRTNTLTASWLTSLQQSKNKVGNKDCDLLVFAGDGRFTDPKTGFDLKADTLKLWLESSQAATAKPNTTGMEGSKPARIQGIGHVDGRSEGAIIENTDLFDALFQDVGKPIRQVAVAPTAQPPAKVPAIPATASATAPSTPVPPPAIRPNFVEPSVSVAVTPQPAKPMRLSARKIDATIARSPVPANPNEKNSKPGFRYEIDKAECLDRVVVHQDAPDPKKSPNGTHITGNRLLLDQLAAGHVMKVYGTEASPAFVQFEDTTIIGPDVDINQPDNRVVVKGRGSLKMPSSTDLAGTPLGEKSEMIVDFKTSMNFRGELRSAEFIGEVLAKQLPPERKAKTTKISTAAEPYQRSYVFCHRLSVTFDKPIYFNQMQQSRTDSAKKKPGDKSQDDAKVERVLCEPQSEDVADLDKPQPANYVYFADETVDLKTGKQLKGQRITAKYLDVNIQDNRTVIHATGPGETRTLQIGTKDNNAQPAPAAPVVNAAAGKSEEEMKLTVVRFAERLMIEDQKQIFQKAVFTSNVRAFYIPSDTLDAKVDEHSAPPRSIVIKCTDKMTATTYQNKAGLEDRRTLEAIGDARVRTDDYDGNGHTIDYDGTFVILRALGDGQATLYRRVTGVARNRDYNSGNPITYNIKTKTASVNDSTGGAFTNIK
jgi:hypothetical protein